MVKNKLKDFGKAIWYILFLPILFGWLVLGPLLYLIQQVQAWHLEALVARIAAGTVAAWIIGLFVTYLVVAIFFNNR